MRIFCLRCNTEIGNRFQPICQCGGMIDIEYNLKQVKLHNSTNPFKRFKDLLPIKTPDLLPDDAAYTPLIHSQGVGPQLGLSQLYLKNETVLPTGTTKARMAATALAYLYENGVREFCTSSTGNSSTAFAHYLSNFPGMELHIFSSSEFVKRVHLAPGTNVHHHILMGASFVEAYKEAIQYAERRKIIAERGFFNPGRREGLKLAWLEAVDQAGHGFSWYVQAVSSAMGVYGVYKGAQEMRKLGIISNLPRLLCVQQETCSPMVNAWNDNSDEILPHNVVKHPTGIAKAILRGDPTKVYPYIKDIVLQSKGDFVSVTEHEIREARQLAEQQEGLSICYSSATAIAGLKKLVEFGKIGNEGPILVNLTGRDRPDARLHGSERMYCRKDGDWDLTVSNSSDDKKIALENGK